MKEESLWIFENENPKAFRFYIYGIGINSGLRL